MPNFDSIIEQLQQERDRLDSAIQALTSLNGSLPTGTRTGRTMSVAARARIAKAQRARWAKLRGASRSSAGVPRPRRKISAAGLARIRAAQRARWAKLRAGKK